MKTAYAIEFRNGSYFQGLDADRGGSLATAQTFSSEGEADDFCHKHEWILFNGGMVIGLRIEPAT